MIHCGYGEKEEGWAENESQSKRKEVGRSEDIRQQSASCSSEKETVESCVEGAS
jgi:hypothetical protein